MIPIRIGTFAYGGIEHLFSPPGLPLVKKSNGVAPTTSVLVRGSAGSGKSTLALALAHAIAMASGGMVLYLVTEASPSDVAFKAETLGLDRNVVVPYDASAPHAKGEVAVSHLILQDPEAEWKSTQELHTRAIETAYALLEKRNQRAVVPISALVIDGLSLPETGSALSRRDLVTFLQALESRGVSPILVEESGPGASEQFTFAVDVVLGLSFDPDPESGALGRKITVTKSRYAESTPGPHDAGFEEGKPAVWPSTPSLDFGGDRPPWGLFMPMKVDDRVSLISINRGALVLSHYDKEGLRIIRAWQGTPGLQSVIVNCGPTTLVASTTGKTRAVPYERGPFALAWAIHASTSENRAPGVLFQRLSYLLERPRYASSLPGLLDALVRRGILVCVHDSSQGLRALDSIADYSGATGHHNVQDILPPKSRDYRAVSAWTEPLPSIERPRSHKPKACTDILGALDAARAKLGAGDLAGAEEALSKVGSSNDPGAQRLFVEVSLLLDTLGRTQSALGQLRSMDRTAAKEPLLLAALGWAYAELGDEAAASHVALEGIALESAPAPLLWLWGALWSRYTTTTASLSAVSALSVPGALHARLFAQALAGRGAVAQADALVIALGSQERLPEALVRRLQADMRLESANAEDWREAESRYGALEAEPDTSALERADMTFNRGVIHERLGERDAAVECFREAERVNPLLDMARDRLVALGLERVG